MQQTATQHDGFAIWRTFDASAVNALCNHNDIHPHLSLGGGEIDVTPLMADSRNVFLMAAYGGALFHWTAPGVYAAHDYFLPGGRGRWALRVSRDMLAYMFDAFDARMIWAQTPVENRACRMFNRWLGFKSEGLVLAPLYGGGVPAETEIFVMERK